MGRVVGADGRVEEARVLRRGVQRGTMTHPLSISPIVSASSFLQNNSYAAAPHIPAVYPGTQLPSCLLHIIKLHSLGERIFHLLEDDNYLDNVFETTRWEQLAELHLTAPEVEGHIESP